MLTELLASQERHLVALAEGWLMAGAKGFGVWANEQAVFCWPKTARLEQADLYAEIEVMPYAELRVLGLHGQAHQKRLELDAIFIEELLQLENDLETMTSEFIEMQDQLLAIYDLTKLTRDLRDRETTLKSLVYKASHLVNAEGACLLLQEPNRPLLWAEHHAPMFTDDNWQIFLNILSNVTTHQQLNTNEAPGLLPEGVNNLLLIPIQIRHGTAGLGLINQPDGEFTSPDIKLAQTIAHQAGTQIDLVLLQEEIVAQAKLETEMAMAQSVQLNLLPKEPPIIEGLDLWAASRPALHVGGDFYDFIDEPGRPFVFAVGDVSGKGMPAALLMAMTRTVLRNGARFARPPMPEEFMRRANEDLYDDFTEVSMFVTVFVGRYDPETYQMYYANAGHSPVIYCPAGGKARLLEADGPAMGVLPINLSENHSMDFGPNDLLIVATDGFSEGRNMDGEMFGYDRLIDLAEELGASGKSAVDIAQSMFDTIDNFSSGHMQDDDQTLIVVKGV